MADKLLVDGFGGPAQSLPGRTPAFITGGGAWAQRGFPGDSDFGVLGINGSNRVVPLTLSGGSYSGNASIDVLFAGLTNLTEIRIDFVSQLPQNTTLSVLVRELTAPDTIGPVRVATVLFGNPTDVSASVTGTNASSFNWSGSTTYGLSEAFARGEMNWQLVLLPQGSTEQPTGYVGVVGPSGVTAASNTAANFQSDGAGKYNGYGIRIYVRQDQTPIASGPPLMSSLSANISGEAPPETVVYDTEFLDNFAGTGTLVGHTPDIAWGAIAWGTSFSYTSPNLIAGESVFGNPATDAMWGAQYGYFSPVTPPEGHVGRGSPFDIEFDLIMGSIPGAFNLVFGCVLTMYNFTTAAVSQFEFGIRASDLGGTSGYIYISSSADYSATDYFDLPSPGTTVPLRLKLGTDDVMQLDVFGQTRTIPLDWASTYPGSVIVGMQLLGTRAQRLTRMEWITEPPLPPSAFWTGHSNTYEVI